MLTSRELITNHCLRELEINNVPKIDQIILFPDEAQKPEPACVPWKAGLAGLNEDFCNAVWEQKKRSRWVAYFLPVP